MASPEEFSLVAGKLGIGNDGTIVVYDMPNQHMWLVAWAFLYYGHQDVRLLDGGFEKWTREGRPFSTQPGNLSRGDFQCETSRCNLLLAQPCQRSVSERKPSLELKCSHRASFWTQPERRKVIRCGRDRKLPGQSDGCEIDYQICESVKSELKEE
jgi:hypothetical protein